MRPANGTKMKPSSSTGCSGSVVACEVAIMLLVFIDAVPNSVAGAASQMDTSSTSPGPTVRAAMRWLPSVSENNRVARCASNWRVTASSMSIIWMAAAFGGGFAASIALRLGPIVDRKLAQPDSRIAPMATITEIWIRRMRPVSVAPLGACWCKAV